MKTKNTRLIAVQDGKLAEEARKHNPGDIFEFEGSEYEVVKVIGRPCSKDTPLK